MISSHVLDTVKGTPAVGIRCDLRSPNGDLLAGGITNNDGRIELLEDLKPGNYTLTFNTGEYFTREKRDVFYPEVQISFNSTGGNYHIPLLLSTFGYSTYRGS